MAITLGSQFSLQTTLPLDDRFVAADIAARDSIVSGVRYEGMLVYVLDDETMYQLVGGTTNAYWVEAGGGGGGSGDGFITTGNFAFTQNTSNNALTGELFDSTLINQVDYMWQVKRGTTVFCRLVFSIFFRNGAWERSDLEVRRTDASADHGVTPTVHATTGQVSTNVDNGAGNVNIVCKKTVWAIIP